MSKFVNIRVYDDALNWIAEVSDFGSLIFKQCWESFGEFEIHLNRPMAEIFKNGYFIIIDNDPYMSGIIEYEYNNGDDYAPDTPADFSVKGYSLLALLSRRITIPPATSSDGYRHWNSTPVEDIMYDLVNEQCVSPENNNRKIPNLILSTNRHRGESITFETRHNNLVSDLNTLSIQSGLGVSVKLDTSNKKFIFEVLEGVDRRYSASNPNSFIFCKKFGRVVSQTYEHSTIGTSNMAYVLGEGDGADRTCVLVNDNKTGLNRRELYVDARDIADTVADDEDYDVTESLTQRGNEKLADVTESMAFEFEADTREYGDLWKLGDLCTFRDDYGTVIQDSRITEVTETWEEGRHTVEPVAGHSTVTVLSNAIASASKAAVIERTGISTEFEAIKTDALYVNGILRVWGSEQGGETVINADMIKTGTIDCEEVTLTHLSADSITTGTLTVGNTLSIAGLTFADVDGNISSDQVGAIITRDKITGNLKAIIDTLEADDINVKGRLTAAEGAITSLTAQDAQINTLLAQKAKITDLTASNARISAIEADYLKANDMSAEEARVNTLLTDYAKADDLEATNAQIENLDATYATLDLANVEMGSVTTALIGTGAVGTAQIADGSITDAKIVGLTANKITAGTIDAADIEVINLKASNITVGTINGTQIANGAVDSSKLSSGVTSAITSAQETADGKNKIFYSANEPTATAVGDTWFDTDNGYAIHQWNGTNWVSGLIGSNALSSDVRETLNSVETIDENASQALESAAEALSKAEDLEERADSGEFNAITLKIDSSRGTVFKNNAVSTVLSVVIYHGDKRITNSTALAADLGSGANLQWKWQRMDESTFGIISASDSRLEDNGFRFNLTPNDVDTKCVFMCDLIV